MQVTIDKIMGVPRDVVVTFSKREQEALRRAAAIAEAFRDKLRELYGTIEADDLDIDTTAAGIEHGVGEMLDGTIRLPLPAVSA